MSREGSELDQNELTVFRPKWMPFCACGLVTGAYAFLLLALAVQAESAYNIPTDRALEQIDGLLTNVKVIVAGLEAYGTMWDGIEVMAGELYNRPVYDQL